MGHPAQDNRQTPHCRIDFFGNKAGRFSIAVAQSATSVALRTNALRTIAPQLASDGPGGRRQGVQGPTPRTGCTLIAGSPQAAG